jgi:hypothetical protein
LSGAQLRLIWNSLGITQPRFCSVAHTIGIRGAKHNTDGDGRITERVVHKDLNDLKKGKPMNKRTNLIGVLAVAAVLALTLSLTLTASTNDDKKPDFTIGKKGNIHFNVPVKVGENLLQPGMYEIQHAVEGGDHYITFKQVGMPAGYRHSNTPVANEAAARIKCKVQPVDKKLSTTKITLRTNAAGEKEVAEVQVAGEAFKHIF